MAHKRNEAWVTFNIATSGADDDATQALEAVKARFDVQLDVDGVRWDQDGSLGGASFTNGVWRLHFTHEPEPDF